MEGVIVIAGIPHRKCKVMFNDTCNISVAPVFAGKIIK